MATKPGILPEWASSDGSTVVGSLTATDADYIGAVSQGGANYGQIRYTFSGSPNLSGVIVGHKLTVTGMGNTLNDVDNAYIYAVDDSADTIDILSTSRLDATADESGASGTGTVTDAGAIRQEPTSAKKGQGHLAPQLPNDGYENWWKNNVYQWMQYLDEFVAGAVDVNQVAHGFTVGDAVYESSGTWADAQGNARSTADNTWLVVDVADVDNFTVAREGRRSLNQTAHGYSVNDMLYLDPDTAAGLVDEMPVGNTSRALGYYVPIGKVVAVADVDNFTIDLAIPAIPVFNPVYAEFVSTADATDINRTFSNLSSQAVGGIIDVVLTCEDSDDGTSNVEMYFPTDVPSSTAYDRIYWYDNGGTWTRQATTNTDSFYIARTGSSASNKEYSGNVRMRVGKDDIFLTGDSTANDGDLTVYTSHADLPASNTDITDIRIAANGVGNSAELNDGDFIRLIIHQLPTS